MREEDLERIFAQISPDEALKEMTVKKIDERLAKRTAFKRTRRVVFAAAAAAAVSITAAFAAGNVISYFNSDKAAELTSIEELSRFNEEIGASASRDGYTLTLDNVAADDNYIHVFYTLVSDSPLYADGEPWSSPFAVNEDLCVECIIDNQIITFNNHSDYDCYFEDEYTYKCVYKYNVAARDIPEKFTVELLVLTGDQATDECIQQLYYKDAEPLTDEEKARYLYVAAEVDKSAAEVETVTKEVNRKFTYYTDVSDITADEPEYALCVGEITKIIFSPFGSQMVVEDTESGLGAMMLGGWAMFDENGVSLDILNSGTAGAERGALSTNTLEFLKADENTKALTIVPVRTYEKTEDSQVLRSAVGEYPIVFEVSDYGRVVVTDIRVADGVVAVDYYKDGFVRYDPYFGLLDAEGNSIEPGGKLGCTKYVDVHADTASYTARYVYEAYDADGNRIAPDESVSRESLEARLAAIETFEQRDFVLDYDSAVVIELK